MARARARRQEPGPGQNVTVPCPPGRRAWTVGPGGQARIGPVPEPFYSTAVELFLKKLYTLNYLLI
jgi:hypothetical protein